MQDSIRLQIREDDDYFEEFDEEGINLLLNIL